MAVDTELPFDDLERRVRELLKQEGFGVLTEIDVKSTLKEKLHVEFRRYKIWARAIRSSPIGPGPSSPGWGCCFPATW